ncbi:MAG: hypothetical protein ACPGGN_02475 [Opitutales bacterium]
MDIEFERRKQTPHWKKRENKGYRHFTVNAYLSADTASFQALALS